MGSLSVVVAGGVLAGATSVVAYAYLGYPLLLRLMARRRPAPPLTAPPAVAEWPSVTITVPAYNEASTIGDTLDALLTIDYPPDRLQIIVVSDASSDGTDAIVRGYADRGIELLALSTRGGKTAAENAARPHIRGEIVVNTDASVRIAPDALKPLVAVFADPTIGVASGRDVSVSALDEDPNAGESTYVGYEMWVRDLETRVQGIVGASGCFYAIRKSLHLEFVPDALSRDFAAPLTAREHGFRSVSVHHAVCAVPRQDSLQREYRRKVRTITRGIETLIFKRHLLNPRRYGLFAWMLASHKVSRWAIPWLAVLAGFAMVPLAIASPWGWWMAGAVGLGFGLALVGWWWPEERPTPRVVSIPAFAVTGNLAALLAAIKAFRGDLNPIWEPTRRKAVGS